MGTRYLTYVEDEDGKIRVAQFGACDGYLECAGQWMKEFCSNPDNIQKLRERIAQLEFVGQAAMEDLEREYTDIGMKKNFPQFYGMMGCEVLQHIIDQDVGTPVKLINDFSGYSNPSCEWVYGVNLAKNKLFIKRTYDNAIISYPFNEIPWMVQVQADLNKYNPEYA